MLSDKDLEASGEMGLLFKVDEKTVELYKGYGIDLVNLYGRSEPLMPVPAVFLAGTDNRIRFLYVNPDYRIRLDPRVLAAAAEAYGEKAE